ncbi:protein adenylyltransferase SelO [Noviherbaspirillum saxi]|uniref:Protein nucleotidyltransferase YdiU n=1 Tax=Noviherbaspirillum saxi TaxID=2320863 RepID=A0A3A3FWD8_9BURK|nr:YdiU family protein [Noviherbaspirillum saxi]RJF98471.1 YdiU family protein [Noviherbaspirillum saxi]
MNAPQKGLVHYRVDELPFENSFAGLPASFYTRLQSTPVPAPYLVGASASAAALIGLDVTALSEQHAIDAFSGNRVLPGSEPLSAVYSGHQFGVWAGQLGDGRAILLGDVPAMDGSHPDRLELQIKGAGLTPYSRMGDGRAVLRSSIREFLCSEAMAALGIPTSRALCVTGSDMLVMRETPETSAIATRMAPTFIRFGSFEHWFYNDRKDELKILADYVIDRFYPALRATAQPYAALLTEVTRRTAELMAQWQAVGFMHGVMNTDNMSILGQTIDYGPFGFMEAFDAGHICNHSDHQGRYAYHMQPRIGQWNCFALGQALLPLIGEVDDVHVVLAIYKSAYENKFDQLMHAKLGLHSNLPEDGKLIEAMHELMQKTHVDFTLFFRRLAGLQVDNPAADEGIRDLFIDRPAFDAWAAQYRLRLRQENSDDAVRKAEMHTVNPKFVLRNYLAQIAIEKAQNKDFSEVARLLAVLERPFDEQPENESYAELPPDWANELEVSCSS